MAAIDRSKYEVVPIGITREGRWLISGDPMLALQTGASQLSTLAVVADSAQGALLAIETPGNEHRHRIDVIVPILHGPFGEDGTIQGMLEMANVPYIGAGVLGSAVGMDKEIQKTLFRANGLPVVDYLAVKSPSWRSDPPSVIAAVEETISYPCFVKPCNLGSSVGITKAHERGQLSEAIDLAFSYDRKILIEDAAEDHREVECAVLGNDDPQASVLGEIVPQREFYDYEAKYICDTTDLIIPADLSEDIALRIQKAAVAAFRAIDCAGLARVDFFVERTGGRFYVNELNTIPGFTQISMYPKLWEATGLSYPDLIDRLIELAIERHAEKNQLRTSYR